MTQFLVPARLTLETNALVEADNEEQAYKMFNDGKIINDGRNLGELVNWEVSGRAEQIK